MDNATITTACIELTNRLATNSISDSIAFQLTTELINSVIGCSRTSLWTFNATRSKIICRDLYLREKNTHTSGHILLRNENELYFDALETTKCVVSSDASTHQATKGFNKKYLEPNKIVSKLSLPILHTDEIIGIICNEQCYQQRDWSVNDITAIQEISSMLEPIFASF